MDVSIGLGMVNQDADSVIAGIQHSYYWADWRDGVERVGDVYVRRCVAQLAEVWAHVGNIILELQQRYQGLYNAYVPYPLSLMLFEAQKEQLPPRHLLVTFFPTKDAVHLFLASQEDGVEFRQKRQAIRSELEWKAVSGSYQAGQLSDDRSTVQGARDGFGGAAGTVAPRRPAGVRQLPPGATAAAERRG